MIHPPSNPDAALRDAIQKGNIVFVAGTGVSMSATYDISKKSSHPQASWVGLLKHGLETAEHMGQLTKSKATLYLNLISEDPTTQNLISAASTVTTALGGASSGIFKKWLEDTIGQICPMDRDVIDALHVLREADNLLATTNYDDVLIDHSASLRPVTWMDGDEIIGAQRNRELNKIIYLHGYWKRPDTVILDGRSYDQIARHEEYRDDLAAFWRTTTWVYVGCGVSGLNDPDFGLLLERHGQRARDVSHWDFCLVHKKDQASFQKHFDDLNLNIVAVAYGDNHSALPAFLRSLLPAPAPIIPAPTSPPTPFAGSPIIPHPPAFYAKPDYISRHTFVGRTAQLQVLTDWAKPADTTSILLFEAIGGNGKSMLTWEWTTKHAEAARAGHEPWAGCFWYSFYEKGAIMRDFCLHALHYMTQQPMESLEKKPMADLRTALLAQLHARPWLLIMDGLERVLVAYHRIDAAEVRDEEVNRPTDKILNRDPCDAIRDEDTDLLRTLAASTPSKILISSRLIPRVLLNQAGIPLPGVKPLVLPGLDEADAEALLRSCGVVGASSDIRYYLTNYCGNHPLVIGVLAGLINSPGPHRSDFDAWAADPEYGAKLNLASLDLIQSRNHILWAAMDALEPASRQLLSTLALLSSAVDYETVAAFNPHVPANAKKLRDTITDLEQRGLLQYDPHERRYDLHTVVRGVAAGGMKDTDKESFGQRVVDHYAAQPHDPYEQASTMEDVENGLQVIRTLLKLGHYQQAADAFRGDLARALVFNLEAHVEILSLLRPFFPAGWAELPKDVSAADASYLANGAGAALHYCGEHQKALNTFGTALLMDLRTDNWHEANIRLRNISRNLSAQNRVANALRVDALALQLATVREDDQSIFRSRLDLFADQSSAGLNEAAATWQLLDTMGRNWGRAVYRQGRAEHYFAQFQFWQGNLKEEHLIAAAVLAENDGNRTTLRGLHGLRGSWRLEQGEWALAAASFTQAVAMAREVCLVDVESETGLALAKHHLGQFTSEEAHSEALRLVQLRDPAHRLLAQFWQALGEPDQSKHHALSAYRCAWADGEPYVNRYELTKTTAMLQKMNIPVPAVQTYDPAKDLPFEWEADVRAAIEKLMAEKATKKGK
ncbi:MAG: SIR2 family protein [Prosthecobacter sp.]|uniref:SIR2 family protein n=1 Tax=Prosthecobacter sp. TaxID=1965333 RepID=UPI003BAF796C